MWFGRNSIAARKAAWTFRVPAGDPSSAEDCECGFAPPGWSFGGEGDMGLTTMRGAAAFAIDGEGGFAVSSSVTPVVVAPCGCAEAGQTDAYYAAHTSERADPVLGPSFVAYKEASSSGLDTSNALPSGSLTVGNLLVFIVAMRTNGVYSYATPAGWTLRGSIAAPVETPVAGAGYSFQAVYTREVDGTETDPPLPPFSGAANGVYSCSGVIYAYAKPAGYTWDLECTTGQDLTAGTAFSVTASAPMSFIPKDRLMTCLAWNTEDYQPSSYPTDPNTGPLSLGAVTCWRKQTDGSNGGYAANGSDHAYWNASFIVRCGSGSMTPVFSLTMTGTTGDANKGGVIFLRMRAAP